jgi:hypothetical protein
VNDDGQLFIVDTEPKRARCQNIVGRLPLEGRIWDISIKPYQPRRSVDANKRLWALHKLASDETGHSVDELHELCKSMFLPRKEIEVAGEKREVCGSSAKLSKKDFRDFMERVESFYIEKLGVFLGSE